MKNLCVIPARMGSSRYPNKPLEKILGMPMIGHVALRCKLEPIFHRVVVATCDREIVEYCRSIDVESVMTSIKHERASDRVQEATEILEKECGYRFNSVTMVQGDEPMVTPTMLKLALEGLNTKKAKVINLRGRIYDEAEFRSPNCVKVVCNLEGMALYFSRAAVPDTSKAKVSLPIAYKQICIIPFERDFLDHYSSLKPTYHEEIESVDMNRVLDHGEKIYCVESLEETYPVDVPDDVTRVEKYLKKCALVEKYMK